MTWAGTESIEMVPPTDEPVSTLADSRGRGRLDDPDAAQSASRRVDEELSEDQIDDAVAEIQKAIQRSASSSQIAFQFRARAACADAAVNGTDA